MAFTHLHLHTEYSLLSSAVRISELCQSVKAGGMDAVAITDSGVLFGAVKFYQAAVEAGIKPIIGAEIEIASADGSDIVLLLTEDNQGYHNLIKLISMQNTLRKSDLSTYSQGLIALVGGTESEIARLLLAGKIEAALSYALQYKEIFGVENCFLEVTDHGRAVEKRVNIAMLSVSKKTGIELVATNDVRYLKAEDSAVYAALLAVKNAEKLAADADTNSEYYLKSAEQMESLFSHLPTAIKNTEKIAQRCHFEFDFKERHLPKFSLPVSCSSKQYLLKLCTRALQEFYPNDDGRAKDRMLAEIETISTMGFEDYFLIVWDFVKFAKDKGIFVGTCRGSAGGSIVAYLLNITEVDPLKYGLIFERFLNPERLTMPDIDIDFQDDRRQEVIDYVIEKYGKEQVAQIITFGTLGARAAIRDMGRVLALPYDLVDKTAKLVDRAPKITIEDALTNNANLRELYRNNSSVRYLIDMAKSVEGFPRHTSTHAAGVVISTEALSNLIPLYRHDDGLVTQYDMEKLEQLGLLKIDFLGLSTLTVIQRCLQLINSDTGEHIDFKTHDYDDEKTFRLLSSGRTLGLFQLESRGMVHFLRAYRPKTLEDIIAAVSLYRPGPMDSIDKYIYNKNHPQAIEYLTPELKPILDVTYGCLVYQEQVMEIVRKLAGYSYGRSDLLRRAMSKKKVDVMNAEREIFVNGLLDEQGGVLIDGCQRRGISPEVANAIFDDMNSFAKYAFNKSHAAGYAMLAYQTAYLKTHYPAYFLAANMSSHLHSPKKIAKYINEARQLNIKVFPPDINRSFVYFKAKKGKIRFALAAIKNVGKTLAEKIEYERKKKAFISIEDFILRIDSHALTKNALEALIKAGAFDSLNKDRALLLANYEQMLTLLQQRQRSGESGQISLLDNGNSDSFSYKYVQELNLTSEELLGFECEVMGTDFAQRQKVYLRLLRLGKADVSFIKSWSEHFSGNDKLIIYQTSTEKSIVYAVGVTVNSDSVSHLKRRYGDDNVIVKNHS